MIHSAPDRLDGGRSRLEPNSSMTGTIASLPLALSRPDRDGGQVIGRVDRYARRLSLGISGRHLTGMGTGQGGCLGR